MPKTSIIKKIITCPQCHKNIQWHEILRCNHCMITFDVYKNIPQFTKALNYHGQQTDELVFKLKAIIKKNRILYEMGARTIGAPMAGLSPRKFLKQISTDKTILNIGSGPRVLRDDIINIDIYPYNNVDIIADAYNIPIASNSVDVVICQALIEHVERPKSILDEIRRILKPGGVVYVVAPFMIGFHSSPDDFQRWTYRGLEQLMSKFTSLETGVINGPCSALINIFSEWLAMIFSFNNSTVHQLLSVFFNLLLSPIKFLDYIFIRHKHALNIAYEIYCIGYKRKKHV